MTFLSGSNTSTRRFCNVSEVNVYSLIRRNVWKRCDVRPGTRSSSRERNRKKDRAESETSSDADCAACSIERDSDADSAASSSEWDPGNCAEWETFCPETARRVVPFLSLFGNLTKCFVGGDRCYTRIYWEPTDPNKEYQTNSAKVIREGKYQVYFSDGYRRSRSLYEIGRYNGVTGDYGNTSGKPNDIEVVDNSEESYKEMLVAFVNAFRTMALPMDLEVSGIMEFGRIAGVNGFEDTNNTCDPLVANEGRSCKLCREMCETFPLDLVFDFRVNNPYQRLRTRGGRLRSRRPPRKGYKSYLHGVAGNVCISDRERYSIMNSRPLGRDVIAKKGKDLLRNLLLRGDQSHDVRGTGFDTSSDSFCERMSKRGAVCNYLVFYYHSDTLKRIRALVEAGCPVPCRDEIKGLLSRRIVLIQPSFDALVDMGFPLQKDDFFLVEPATDQFLAHFDWGDARSEEEDIIGDDGDEGDY